MILMVAVFIGAVVSAGVIIGQGTGETPGMVTEQMPEQDIKVSDILFCKNVENREPVDKAETFGADIGKVYCWTVITDAKIPTEIKHVWYFNDSKMAEVPLTVKYERTRTWSYKTILEDMVGNWRVDVVDSEGNIIKSASFKIEKN